MKPFKNISNIGNSKDKSIDKASLEYLSNLPYYQNYIALSYLPQEVEEKINKRNYINKEEINFILGLARIEYGLPSESDIENIDTWNDYSEEESYDNFIKRKNEVLTGWITLEGEEYLMGRFIQVSSLGKGKNDSEYANVINKKGVQGYCNRNGDFYPHFFFGNQRDIKVDLISNFLKSPEDYLKITGEMYFNILGLQPFIDNEVLFSELNKLGVTNDDIKEYATKYMYQRHLYIPQKYKFEASQKEIYESLEKVFSK